MTRVLDRIPHFDERSRAFGVMRKPAVAEAPLRKKVHGYPSVRIDQGQEGHCVGFGISNELAGDPIRISGVNDAFAHGMFFKAQEIDRNEGRVYDDGATVLAGAKAATSLGYMEGYDWAFGIDQMLQALMTGPVVLGIEWRDGMYDTDRRGLVDVSGSVVGGHCITTFGFIPGMRFGLKRIDVIPWVNSWGPSYGKRGIGYVPVESMDALLKADGEAMVPVHRLRPKK